MSLDLAIPPIENVKRLPKFTRLKFKVRIKPGSGPVGVGEIEDLATEEEKDLTRKLGGRPADRKLAKRIISYKGTYPTASFPELITYDWLARNGIRFTFQAHLFGGRSTSGGLVPDFLVEQGGFINVWNIQGVYWHSKFGSRQRDRSTRIRYLGATFAGQRINGVLDLWEDDIYRRRPEIFSFAMAGVEFPR